MGCTQSSFLLHVGAYLCRLVFWGEREEVKYTGGLDIRDEGWVGAFTVHRQRHRVEDEGS